MDSHRVFVMWIHPLFQESLRLLLLNTNIQLVGSACLLEKDLSEIQRLNPDTILVEEEETGGMPSGVFDLMEAGAANVRVFRLSLADNDLNIYHREKRTVLQADDLLNLIREGE
jgi:hypothetical protein